MMRETNNLPPRVGHNYTPVEELHISNVFEQPFYDHRRLGVFARKGFECAHPNCNRVGTRLIRAVDHVGGIHVDVYCDDFHLMTVDHIIPKSKGGPMTYDNLRPMCRHCNEARGNKDLIVI